MPLMACLNASVEAVELGIAKVKNEAPLILSLIPGEPFGVEDPLFSQTRSQRFGVRIYWVPQITRFLQA